MQSRCSLQSEEWPEHANLLSIFQAEYVNENFLPIDLVQSAKEEESRACMKGFSKKFGMNFSASLTRIRIRFHLLRRSELSLKVLPRLARGLFFFFFPFFAVAGAAVSSPAQNPKIYLWTYWGIISIFKLDWNQIEIFFVAFSEMGKRKRIWKRIRSCCCCFNKVQ